MTFEEKSFRDYGVGKFHARQDCIDLVMKGAKKPVQTVTLQALQRDRLRIAKLIAGDDPDLRKLVDSYSRTNKKDKA